MSPDDPQMVAGYVLRARLGAGGMGKVYLSFTPGGRPIAIKVVRPEYAEDEEFRRRFRQEIAAAQRVQGLYTAPVIDADADAPVPWLATAYVPGPSLHQAVSEHGPLPVPTVFRLLGGTAEALASIHGAGLIHRDLKPANVLLAEDGPRVIDFGIARAADATTLTRTGARVGTPAFMAPEQVRGKSATPATDIFALGQLAMWAATGRPAFGEGPTEALLYRIANQPPDLDDCPDELRDIATRCLAKDPDGRPQLTEIMRICRDRTAGDTMKLAESWLPPELARSLAGYHTSAVPPPAAPPPAAASTPAVAPPVVPDQPPGMPAGGSPGGPGPATPAPPAVPVTQPAQPSGGIPVAVVVALVGVVAVAVLVSVTVGAVMLSSNRSGDGRIGGAGTTGGSQAGGEQSGRPGNNSPGNDRGSADPRNRPSTERSAAVPNPSGTTVYTESGFKIGIPNGWNRRTNAGDGSGSVYWDAPDGITYVQVDPRPWDSPGTARAQAERADAVARKPSSKFQGYTLIGLSDLTYQGGEATDWDFAFTDSGGTRTRSKDRFFQANGRPFALYLRAPDSDWDSLQDELNGFYTTFQAT